MSELRDAIVGTAGDLGIDPVDLATVMSYETAGTFNPWKKGPVTQWGRHRGLIQWGAPQRQQYGVYKGMPVADQVKAAGEYLKDAGVRPGMGILDVYSAINAGKVGRYNASDANNGGAPGTVRDKVENQMGSHRRKALALIGGADTATFDPTAFGAVPLDAPANVAQNTAAPATAAFAPDAPANPALGALDNLVQPVAGKPGYQVAPVHKPVPFVPPQDAAQPPIAAGDGSAGPSGNFPGLVTPGNIDLSKRPVVKNADGTISTVRSMSFGEDGKEILIPTVSPDGKILSDQQAIDLYHQTGQNLGIFDTPQNATTYAQSLHQSQANFYGGGQNAQPAFDPVAAGAVPFDPAQFGAVPVANVDPATNQPPGVPAYQPPGVSGYDPQTGNVTATSPNDKVGAFLTGVADLPVVGPAIKEGQRDLAAGIAAPFSNSSYGQIRQDMGQRQDQVTQDNPGTALAGNVVGTIGTLVPAAATETGGLLLGTAGNSLIGRMGMSAASNGLMSAADTAVRGGTLEDVMKSGAYGAGIGGALPGAGAIVNGIGRAVADSVGPRVNALVRPAYEAARRVGAAMGMDAKNTAAPVLNATDEAAAAANGQQLLNVDRGGETTRALARSAANQDPEARAIIDKTVSDRFASQGDRAQSFISRLMGGATDDLALQDSLKSAAQASNGPAYKRAFSAVPAQDMSNPALLDMLKSPAVRQAATDAEKRGADRAVIEGSDPVRNPFVFDQTGNVSLKQGVKPTLQFWNQVKINLDGEIGKAVKAGDRTLVSDLKGLKTKLVSELDKAVPEYASARRGAAAFFGAEDALDAGKKFVSQNRTIPETKRALAQMSPAERSTFAVGFASELKDAIAQSGDRTNVINKIFGSQQSRDKIQLALGQKAFGEFEQFVRVEHSMDMLRGAMGNSTTARQLVELGMAGGVGGATGLYTGDYRKGITAALLTGLARRGGAAVDAKVTKRIAELLLTDDPKALQQAVTIAANSPKATAAIQAIESALSMATKTGGNLATRPTGSQPLDLAVHPSAN